MPPVLQRELRSHARHWGTYWMRVLAVILGFVALGTTVAVQRILSPFLGAGGGGSAALVGGTLFISLHGALTVAFAVICPLITADALARERREGTLGLLFLTPLEAHDVVLGKCAMFIVRTFSLWVALLPLLAVPFLMGGVGPIDLFRALVVEGSVVLTGLAAGLLATAGATRWTTATTLALAYFAGLALLQAVACDAGFLIRYLSAGAGGRLQGAEAAALLAIPFAVCFAFGGAGALRGVGIPGAVTTGMDGGLAAMAVVAVIVFILSLFVATWAVRRSWRTDGATAKTKGPGNRPRRRPGPATGTNPVLWLQQSSGHPGRARLGLLLAVGLAWCALGPLVQLYPPWRSLTWWVPAWLLVGLTFLAAGSYRQEIEEGTLELFLVTPLAPNHLVTGRWQALFRQFLPGFALALLPAVGLNRPHDSEWYLPATVLLSSFGALPVIGIRCAFRRVPPLFGAGLTFGWGVGAPGICALALSWSLSTLLNLQGEDVPRLWAFLFCLFQWAAAFWWWGMAVQDLETRDFMLRPLQRRPGSRT